MVNGKYIINVHWPNSTRRLEGFCAVCEQPWVDLNPLPFALKATTLTTAPRRPHTIKENKIKENLKKKERRKKKKINK